MRRRPVGLALWLLILAGVQTAALVLIWRLSVRTAHGQSLDTIALYGNTVGRAHIAGLVNTILNTMSALWLAVAALVVGFVALARRRIAVAVGVIILIVGANLTAELLKHFIVRPDLGIDPERAAAGNSLPSGHTAVAASVAVALILVLPNRLRGAAALLGAAFTAVIGVATLSAGWHRPSDAIAALLIVGVWACAAGLFIILAQRRHGDVEYGHRNRTTLIILAVCGLALSAGTLVAIRLSNPVLATPLHQLGRHQLLIAYIGGAAAITAATTLILAATLATAHRVVPRMVPRPVPSDEHPALAPA